MDKNIIREPEMKNEQRSNKFYHVNKAWQESNRENERKHKESINKYHEIINRNCYKTQQKKG